MSTRRTIARLLALAMIFSSLTACETRGFGNSDGGGLRSGGLFRF
jgi:hypothetical protein